MLFHGPLTHQLLRCLPTTPWRTRTNSCGLIRVRPIGRVVGRRNSKQLERLVDWCSVYFIYQWNLFLVLVCSKWRRKKKWSKWVRHEWQQGFCSFFFGKEFCSCIRREQYSRKSCALGAFCSLNAFVFKSCQSYLMEYMARKGLDKFPEVYSNVDSLRNLSVGFSSSWIALHNFCSFW